MNSNSSSSSSNSNSSSSNSNSNSSSSSSNSSSNSSNNNNNHDDTRTTTTNNKNNISYSSLFEGSTRINQLRNLTDLELSLLVNTMRTNANLTHHGFLHQFRFLHDDNDDSYLAEKFSNLAPMAQVSEPTTNQLLLLMMIVIIMIMILDDTDDHNYDSNNYHSHHEEYNPSILCNYVYKLYDNVLSEVNLHLISLVIHHISIHVLY